MYAHFIHGHSVFLSQLILLILLVYLSLSLSHSICFVEFTANKTPKSKTQYFECVRCICEKESGKRVKWYPGEN